MATLRKLTEAEVKFQVDIEPEQFEPDFDDPTAMVFINERRRADQTEAWCCITVTAAWECPHGETYTATAHLGGVSLDAGQHPSGPKVARVVAEYAKDEGLYAEALEALNDRLTAVVLEAATIIEVLKQP